MYTSRILSAIQAAQLLTLAAPSYATPLAHVFPRQSVEDICSVDYSDPAAVWQNTGAASFLEKFLAENGPDDWVANMDQKTTAGGTQGHSNLNCVDLLASNCRYPTVQCQFYTPPELFHIRNAIATAHSIFVGLHEGLQSSTIENILKIDQIVADFGPPDEPNPFSILAGIFGILWAVTGANPIAGAITGIASSAFGLASLSPSDPGPGGELKAQLAQHFTDANAQLEAMTRKIFGGEGLGGSDSILTPDLILSLSTPLAGGAAALLQTLVAPGYETITDFFKDGKFLRDGGLDETVRQTIIGSGLAIRQRLAMTALSKDHLIFAHVGVKDQAECEQYGQSGRFLLNQCFSIWKVSTLSHINSDMLGKFDDGKSGYDLRLEDLYLNAFDCWANYPLEDSHEMGTEDAHIEGATRPYPKCFFNMVVVSVNV
ncbi:uncharacterized protein DNG_07522 [Cephalotrichum gorgonifer]|uniref:Uncharacterized protein n=1 Tax=Cephalotrichum gorgonifer TaxID=2041049 RepID=A0AAE8N2J3_9PEZI|nr:uncharacterized protein DNG_07522 [Cephalotrichum gorgonifer]